MSFSFLLLANAMRLSSAHKCANGVGVRLIVRAPTDNVMGASSGRVYRLGQRQKGSCADSANGVSRSPVALILSREGAPP